MRDDVVRSEQWFVARARILELTRQLAQAVIRFQHEGGTMEEVDALFEGEV